MYEEMKMILEIKKIMEDVIIKVLVICVCIFVLLGYFEFIYIEMKELVLIFEIKKVIVNFFGVVL